MTINRHNYEEFFILYMDNELEMEDRREVEAFVQLHPDLKEELDLLFQFKLEPDHTLVFEGKEELLKINLPTGQAGGEKPVSLSNYEEWMLLSADNELNAVQQWKFEQFMIVHPVLQKEFEQLKRARLQPEPVVFTGKASLYRKEEKVRRLPIWWRFAAAAILLLAVGITAVIVINRNSIDEKKEFVKGETPVIRLEPKTPVLVPPAPVKENMAVNNAPEEKIIPRQSLPKEKNMVVNRPAPLSQDKIRDVIVPIPQKEEEVVVAVQKNNDLPTPRKNHNTITNNKINIDIASHVPSEFTQQKNSLTNPHVTTDDPGSSDIMTAAADQSDGKNKSRGLFRKIARTFEKRTSMDPTDDNRLLVAGLAIKLK